jgi:hypothetical protein
VPVDIASTGWPAIRATCYKKLGTPFDPWQDGAGRVVFAQREDGSLAARVDGVGWSLPRQVGKTYFWAAVIFALCINRPGTLVIWSAHHGKTHAETFLAMQAFAKRLRVAPFIDQVYTGSGDESVVFRNGSRILFGARERGFGRGIPGVDVMVFDEAQILSSKALANMLAAMNTSTLGLHVYIGTPPAPHDASEAFHTMRTLALAGELPDGAWMEFGANRGDDPNSPKTWAKANPSFPHRTPADSIKRLQRKLAPDDFLREALGIWDEDEDGWALFSSEAWKRARRPARKLGGVPSVAIAASPDLAWAAIGAARLRRDKVWGKLLAHGPGVDWLVDQCVKVQDRTGADIIVDKGGPCSSLITELEDAGVNLTLVGGPEVCDASAWLYRAVEKTGTFREVSSPKLAAAATRAARAADWRKVGDRRAFGRASGDITAVEALALAGADALANDYDVADSVG